MLALVRPALVSMGLFTLVLGIAYPLAVTGIAQAVLPEQAGGSLIRRDGQVVGSVLIGQSFAQPGYLHGRPSAAGSDGYDAAASSGSNLGPLNPDLIARVKASADELRPEAGGRPIPADAVTASGSGLDPDISPAYAELQAARIAAARGVPVERVRAVIGAHVADRTFGVLGQPRVNVLQANLALDEALGRRQPPPR
ncbi:MAG: potassium-transporting ATPase subunit C [Phenylobacterium zucineum]|nr:MAG: potassium-transporting ATPase subunit C [Phenylobacterium zucineum]